MRNIIDLFFPSICIQCGRLISFFDNHLCSDCLSGLSDAESGCPKCGSSLSEDGSCEFCGSRSVYFDKNIIVCQNNKIFRKMIYQYKFSGKKRLAEHFYQSSIPKIESFLNDSGNIFDCITAVPIKKSKIKTRGYNQSEIIARKLSKHFKVDYYDILSDKNMVEQKKLNYSDRFIYTIDRFVPKKVKCEGNILIVDDVFTSGATINECSRILKKWDLIKYFH